MVDSDGDGVDDSADGCPLDATKAAPGICGCGTADTDDDGDGTVNCNDGCKNDASKTSPGVCGCGNADTDSDGDGTPDCNDECDGDPAKTAPAVCGCGIADTDSDSDGTPDCNDGCVSDASKTAPGVCGCGMADTDSDSDSTPDCNDGCVGDALKTSPGICGCGVADTDSDSDGTPDCNDECNSDPTKTAAGACGCGVADTDSDSDGTLDCNDGCVSDASKTSPGACGCGTADTDSDSDGTPDCNDECDSDAAKTAPGVCGCGIADTDSDSDGTPDCNDECDSDAAKTSPGVCGCGIADTDSDGDGTLDCNDGCDNDASKTSPGACGCNIADTDSDGDGTPDCDDGCDNDASKTSPGTCGCGVPDAVDSSGDTICGAQDCIVSAWSSWSACSVACGGGLSSRTRTVTSHASNGGASCPTLVEHVPCGELSCPRELPVLLRLCVCTWWCVHGSFRCTAVVDCVVGAWTQWSACSDACGGGGRLRHRPILVASENGGAVCPDLIEQEACGVDTCSNTGACANCWPGSQGPCQSGIGVCYAANAGTSICPAGTASCGSASPTPCVVDPWSEWGKCTATCGGGTQLRTRGVSSPASHGGDACGDLFESRTCNTDACSVPVACEVSEWGAWDECSVDCGGGTQSRARSVVVPASGGGAACPLLTESRTCNDDACVGEPVDCVISEWGPWSECVAGSADQSRSRSVVTPASNGGSACPSELVQTRTSVCVVDCVASEWSDWGPCSLACGGGVQDRSRSVDVVAQNGGLACGALSESRGCNSEACAAECASCFPGSSGNCRSVFNVCYAAAGGVCPAGTVACTGLAGVLSVATTGTPQGAVRGRIEVHDTPGDFPHTTESWASSPLLHSFRVVVARLLSSPSRHEVTPAHVVAGLAEVSGDMAVVDIEVLSFAANDVLGRPATRSPADLALQLSSAVINGSLALDLKAAGVINASSVGTVAMAEALSVEAARGDENDIANSEGGPESDPADAPSNHTYLWLALGGAAVVAIAAVVVAVGRKRPTRVQTLPTVHAMPQRPRVASVPPLATVAEGNTGSGRVVWE